MPKDGWDLGILIRLHRWEKLGFDRVMSELISEVGWLKGGDDELKERLDSLIEEGLIKTRHNGVEEVYSLTEWAGRPQIKCPDRPQSSALCSAVFWNCKCKECPVPANEYGLLCFKAIECSKSEYEEHRFPAVCLNRKATPMANHKCFGRGEGNG